MTGVAYDAAYPPVDVLCSSAALFISCYTDGKYATPLATIERYRAAGKGVLPNHERGEGDLLGGYPAGVQAANACMPTVAGWQCPQDGSVAIFYSVDQSVTQAQFSAVGEAFDGINAAHAGRWKTGVYGEGALIDYLVSTGRVQVKGWLSASMSYPGWNPNSPNVGMWQMVGSNIPGTDQNEVTQPDGLGVWWPPGYKPSGGGTQEDDVTLEDIEAIANAVVNKLMAYDITVPQQWSPSGKAPFAYVTSQTLSVATVLFNAEQANPSGSDGQPLTQAEIDAIATAVDAEIHVPTAQEVAKEVLDEQAERLQS